MSTFFTSNGRDLTSKIDSDKKLELDFRQLVSDLKAASNVMPSLVGASPDMSKVLDAKSEVLDAKDESFDL